MDAVAEVHIFLDTNVALHFRRPDQIAWNELMRAERVVLVASPILIAELEKQKVHNQSRKLRDRAAEFIKWMAQFHDGPSLEVRDGVQWQFIPYEPKIDFQEHGLVREVADDQLIASVLTYKTVSDCSLVVATGDLGLRVKLRHKNIRCLPLPDDLRLPVELDPVEKELQELRIQVAQRREPVLRLSWGNGQEHRKIPAPEDIISPNAPSLSEIRSKHPLIYRPGEVPDPIEGPLAGLMRNMGMAGYETMFMTPEKIDGYNEKLKEFYDEYQSYLDQLLEWERRSALTSLIELKLENSGTAPATHVDVELTFPSDIKLLEEADFPEQPKPPKVPLKPTLQNMFRGYESTLNSFDHGSFIQPPILSRDGDPDIDHKKHSVNFQIATFKHLFDFDLNGVCFQFSGRKAIRSFQISYMVTAAELPKALTGNLHVVIENRNAR